MPIEWTTLSEEVKKKVAGKLDFMTRHSLNSTSRSDRDLVNSVQCHVPRVRFGYRNSNGLIMIYTGIEQFLRLEFTKCTEGTMIHKSESTWDRSEVLTKMVPNRDPLQCAISIFKSLLCGKSISIGAMEWDVEPAAEFYYQLVSMMDTSKILVKKWVMMKDSFMLQETLVPMLCDMEKLEQLERVGIEISSKNLIPVMILEMNGDDTRFKHKPYAMTKIAMSCEVSEILLFQRTCSKTVLESNDIAVATCRQLSAPGTPARKPSSNRHEKNLCFQFSNLSKCGRWAQIASTKNIKLLIDNYEKDPCGLSWLCKSCSDRFDHWYHMNLPRRIIQEPLWTCVFGFAGPDYEKEMKSLKLKLERDEKNKEKQRKKKKKMVTPSWGFRSDSYVPSNLDKNREKKNRKKEKRMARKAVELTEPNTEVSVLAEPNEPMEAGPKLPDALEPEIPKPVEAANLVVAKAEVPKPKKCAEPKPEAPKLQVSVKPTVAAKLKEPKKPTKLKPGASKLRKPVEPASTVKYDAPNISMLKKPEKTMPEDFKLSEPTKTTKVKPVEPTNVAMLKPDASKLEKSAKSKPKTPSLQAEKLAEPVKPTEEVLERCKTFDKLWEQFCGDQM